MIQILCVSLLNRVPRVPKCLSVRVFKCPSSAKCQSALRVSDCLKYPSAQAPFEYPSVPNAQVLWVPECWCALQLPWVPECPLVDTSALGTRRTLEVPWVPECLECLERISASVNHLFSQPVSQLVYNADSVS